MDLLGLYIEFIRIKWRTAAQYRGSFLLTAFSKFVSFGADFVTVFILVNRFESLGGWDAAEVLCLTALAHLSYAFGAMFSFHTARAFDQMARNGEMDALLTKPVNPFLYLLANKFSTGYVGNILIALSCLLIGLRTLQFTATVFSVGMIILAVVGGAMIDGAMMILTSIPSIYKINVDYRGLLYYMPYNLVRYPISIFGTGVRILMTFLLPYAFIAFYPAQAIFGKTPIFHPLLQYISPFIGLFLCFITYRYFQYATNRYQGSGT